MAPGWTHSNKSAVGTAHSNSGRLWFTMRKGIVTEVSYPTIDRPSTACLLCEQLWDESDVPAEHMRLGEPTGSAMPLMWAHAEYVKLLRSAADGKVFDRIPAVAERYLSATGKKKKMEVWQFNRRVRFMRAGEMLRVIGERRFVLRWTSDHWTSRHDSASQTNRLAIDHVDLIELRTTSRDAR
jgi:glucoamylase